MAEFYDLDDPFENIAELAEDVKPPINLGEFDTDLVIKGDQLRQSFLRGQAKGVRSSETNTLTNLFVSRRKGQKLTVESLSNKAGVGLDSIIDLECRQLHLSEAKKVCKDLMEVLKIDLVEYKRALQSDKYNLKVQSR